MTGVSVLVDSWFKALLALVTLALSTNILVGPSLRWRPAFISGALAMAVASEYYYLFFAVMKVPRDWADNKGVEIQRLDCRQSDKGGKRGESSTGVFDINPCFCPHDGSCSTIATGAWLDPSVCPKDDSAFCWDSTLREVPLYIESGRDCMAAQGTRCTKEEPCTPCDLNAVEAFLDARVRGAARCRRCGAGNRGACSFVLDEGPYCWKGPGSAEVEPCSVCCTDPEVLHINGKCY